MTSRHDYVKIHLTITYVPKNQLWRDGLLTQTHTLTLPVETIDTNLIAKFIQTNIQEIQNVVQTENETN